MESTKDIPKLGPPPKASSKTVSKVMKSNVAKDTGLELLMKRELRKAGLGGFKSNPKDVVGRPDIVFIDKKIAIFVHGCFWHHCPKHNPHLPKTNTDFWERKFLRNKERDRRKRRNLEKLGWKVFEFWEHDVNENPDKLVKRISKYVR